MSKYDFTFLSSFDFEELVRDLLQAELSIHFESFKPGKDGGVDLRCSLGEDQAVIVQCKHYAGSLFKMLFHRLKHEEKEKVEKLKPTRYILATSLGLTPKNKQDIQKLFSPYCLSPGDVFGREDLNNLLGKHPDIEKRNFKLWLTSQAVLERVLHSAIFTQTDFELESIKRKLKYYVQNSSFFKAKEILESHHCCIVAGIPGIGKTTLAEILLIDYLANGFQPIKVSSDIKEATEVHHSGSKRIYYYDDFLGQTSLENKLGKNEEQNLISFLEAAAKTESIRIVLTTREYILNQARANYERLSRSNLDIFKCVINLSNYTRFDRAKILFNHVYFSGLSRAYRAALLADKNYLKVVDHPNFNPRIIEWMTDYVREAGVEPDEYVSSFLRNLSNPAKLWEHAFQNQISNASRHLLIVLATLPSEVLLEDLEAAFSSFYKGRAEQYHFQTLPNDFLKALKELEGSFIHTQKVGSSTIARFHNPSIKDFLEGYLASNPSDVISICLSAIFFDQCTALWEYETTKASPSVRSILLKHPEEHWKCIRRVLGSGDSRLINVVSRSGGLIGKHRYELPLETRVTKVIEVERDFPWQGTLGTISNMLRLVWTNLKAGNGDKEGLLRLLSRLEERAAWYGVSREDFLEVAKNFLAREQESIDDFGYYIDFKEKFPEAVTDYENDAMTKKFIDFYPLQVDSWLYDEEDANYLEQEVATFKSVSRAFDLEINDEIDRLSERISELHVRASGPEEDSDGYGARGTSDLPREFYDEDEAIRSLFESLAEPRD